MRHLVETFPSVVFAATLGLAAGAAAQTDPAKSPITWQAAYTGEAAANVDGGLREGQAYAGQILLGADVDLDKAFGWDGTRLHVAVTNRHGDNLVADDVGGSTSVQEIYGAQNTRLARLTLEKSFLDGRLVVEGGRTVANISFLGSPLCNAFQLNAACGNPTFVFKTSNFTWWPVSSWGGHATAWLTPKVYAHVGVYEVNPGHQSDDEHGFDWGASGSTGVVAPFALGYATTFANDAMPRRYEIGGWYDGADYVDPLRDATGAPAATSGRPYATRNGRSGAFFRFEQMVTRPDPASHRGLTVFGTAMAGTSGRLVEDHFLELGFVQRGTFKSRPEDTVGFVVTQQKYSHDALENLRLARAAAGGTGTPPSDQVMMELSYGAQLGPSIRVQPNLIYIVHPDQLDEPGRRRDARNAFIVGLRFDINLADLARARR
ncbi:carbohydrate-selective porin [Caulobacter sp. AP07]|uniref:carbohydrate porin n=1 Tax=Caulobacter sp. AP07 TaxID=1144304 RepID=UPI000271FD0C|nr:carbohydrate porin [Caulobacter sp. AP07]EJL22487.1 carbohydrate-selective porin [Caulobacter sp. AP07]